MTENPITAQLTPSSNVIATLYTVPSSNSAIGTIFCTNASTDTSDKIGIALIKNGQELISNCWICYQTTVYYSEGLYIQQLSLGSQDSISVISQNGTSSFTFNGNTIF